MSPLKAYHRVYEDRSAPAPQEWDDWDDILKPAAWFRGGLSASVQPVNSPKTSSLPPPPVSKYYADPPGERMTIWNSKYWEQMFELTPSSIGGHHRAAGRFPIVETTTTCLKHQRNHWLINRTRSNGKGESVESAHEQKLRCGQVTKVLQNIANICWGSNLIAHLPTTHFSTGSKPMITTCKLSRQDIECLTRGMAGLFFNDYEPLVGFPQFSRLPAELRIKIWKHALPVEMDSKGRRILSVRGSIRIVGTHPARGISMTFYIIDAEKSPKTSLQSLNTSCLSACKESRAIHLESFPYCLRFTYEPSQLVYFNDYTTISLHGFRMMLPVITNAIKLCHRLPECFTTIKRLGLCSMDFWVRYLHPPVTEAELFTTIRSFRNLEHLTIWRHKADLKGSVADPVVDRLREYLENYQANVESSYRAPVIEIVG